VRSDGPTIPNLGWYDSGAGAAPGAPSERGTPTWPTGDERPPRAARGSDRWPRGYVSALALGASLAANVVLLLSLLAVLLLGHASLGAAGGPTGSPVTGAALSSPTAATSATPLSGGLQVTPSSVHLGCASGQRTQFVLLLNTGPQRVQWQATVASTTDQAGLTLSPDHGRLNAGASQPIQLQNTAQPSDSGSGASQQGVIHFAVSSADTGQATSLSYTVMICP
jgi:hypothetical protein